MRTSIERLLKAALLCACAAACGGFFPNSSNGADPYLGYVDGLGLDAKFLPAPAGVTCSNGPCYPVQQGWAHGRPAFFYNLGAVPASSAALVDASGNFAVPTSLVTINAYDFSPGCATPTNPYTFDPVSEAYPSNVQFPIFNGLPLTSYVFDAIVMPFVAHYAATEASGTICQYLKDSSSIGTKFGSSGGQFVDFQMWPVIDVVTTGTVTASSGITSSKGVSGATCPITEQSTQTTQPCPVEELPTTSNSANLLASCDGTYKSCSGACTDNVCVVGCQSQYIACSTLEQQGWTSGLQLTFLNGGTAPTDGNGNFLFMDGALVHPSAANQLSAPNAGSVVILPALPGEAGYAPIVRLHDFHVPPGTDLDPFGDFDNTVYTDVCASGTNCQPNQVNLVEASSSSNVLFVVMSAP
jgi:hypothetical protein